MFNRGVVHYKIAAARLVFILLTLVSVDSLGRLLLALVFLFLSFLFAGRFGDHLHHALLEAFLLEEQAVLVPDEVRVLDVEVVTLHAPFEKLDDVLVVGVLGEGEAAAVVHELFEFGRLVQAQLVDGHLLLLALDVIIFLVLGATGETLPGQRSAEEI